MEDLEKQIDEAADDFAAHGVWKCPISFTKGVKSEAAKQYWLQKLSEEFESKSGDEWIDTIEVVNKVLKSDMAKEYWKEQFRQNNELYIALKLKGMYSEEEVEILTLKAMRDVLKFINGKLPDFNEDTWFEKNKKK